MTISIRVLLILIGLATAYVTGAILAIPATNDARVGHNTALSSWIAIVFTAGCFWVSLAMAITLLTGR